MTTLTLTRPDDWHVHFRDREALAHVVPHTARRFARAIVMPNLVPPVTTTAAATAYRDRVLAAVPPECGFEPLMTLYLTDETSPDEIVRARESAHVHAVKLYPAGATTNSAAGVTSMRRVDAALGAMQESGLPLLVHGEVVDADIDVFDRERVFLERVLAPLVERYPDLRVVLEHVTTREGVEFVRRAPANVAATITAHHLLIGRNAMFAGGLRPHHYCLPVPKREEHRRALVAAATSGEAKFFLGTDSAPHARRAKESACGCAGVFTAHAALELYAEAFADAGALEALEAFAAGNGAAFYGLPRNEERVHLEKRAWEVPGELDYPGGGLVPFRAGECVAWSLASA